MTFWQCFQEAVAGSIETEASRAEGVAVLRAVVDLAAREERAPEAVIFSLLDQALQARRYADCVQRKWEMLSPRERQVAELVCRRLTTRQIAAELVLSPETIRTHMRHILRKFRLHSRQDLRRLLADRDFGAFLEANGVMRLPVDRW